MENQHWNLSRPILLLYTQLNLLYLPELQFKLLYENEVDIPKQIQMAVFGDRLSDFSKKGKF